MALEIEHKYLVANNLFKEMAFKNVQIKQGYLNRMPERTVRVRIIDNKGFLTIKSKNKGDVRHEYEYEVPYDDALDILTLCEPGIIDKTRYFVKSGDLIWEVDEYHGSRDGLVIAEVEIPEPGYKYDCPPFVGENVTGDIRYYNSNL